MDCRSFRRRHQGYLDDTLPGVEMTEMQHHLRLCEVCAHQDASVRRSLFLLHNLPSIKPSEDFADRLRLRLLADGALGSRLTGRVFHGPSLGVFASVAGSVVAVGVLSLAVFGLPVTRTEYPLLPAVVALAPVALYSPGEEFTGPAFVAAMSTGMPVWPALLLAEEGSLRFATAELEPVSWTPPRPR